MTLKGNADLLWTATSFMEIGDKMTIYDAPDYCGTAFIIARMNEEITGVDHLFVFDRYGGGAEEIITWIDPEESDAVIQARGKLDDVLAENGMADALYFEMSDRAYELVKEYMEDSDPDYLYPWDIGDAERLLDAGLFDGHNLNPVVLMLAWNELLGKNHRKHALDMIDDMIEKLNNMKKMMEE